MSLPNSSVLGSVTRAASPVLTKEEDAVAVVFRSIRCLATMAAAGSRGDAVRRRRWEDGQSLLPRCMDLITAEDVIPATEVYFAGGAGPTLRRTSAVWPRRRWLSLASRVASDAYGLSLLVYQRRLCRDNRIFYHQMRALTKWTSISSNRVTNFLKLW